jgi:large subunit ribosomal protein L21
MDYAIIELCGKQYRVQNGDSLLVDRLDAKQGAKIAPRALLWRSDGKTVLDGPDLGKVKVEAVVAEHLKGEKIRVFKYRPKKRYRRRAGHRSLLTRVEIKGISGPGSGRPSAAAAEGRNHATAAAGGQKPAAASAGAGKPAKASAGPKPGADARRKPPSARAAKAEPKDAPAKKKGAAGAGPKKPRKPSGKSESSAKAAKAEKEG